MGYTFKTVDVTEVVINKRTVFMFNQAFASIIKTMFTVCTKLTSNELKYLKK